MTSSYLPYPSHLFNPPSIPFVTPWIAPPTDRVDPGVTYTPTGWTFDSEEADEANSDESRWKYDTFMFVYIDVNNVPPDDVATFVEANRSQFGVEELKEDGVWPVFIPIRDGGSGTRFEIVPRDGQFATRGNS